MVPDAVAPYSCSYVRDEILNVKGYRKIIVESYIIFHLVREEEKQVVIMLVLYGKQKYQELI
jgi:toxin ParE1/3/4